MRIWFVIIVILLIGFLVTCLFTQSLLIKMHEEPTPYFLPREAVELVCMKQQTEAYLTMAFKMLCVPCVKGFNNWSSLMNALLSHDFPTCDAIVGITSGGWIIGLLLAHLLQKPCYQMKFSRYNNKDIFQKMVTFFEGHKTNLNEPEHAITITPKIHKNHRKLLLVDDSIGSGATMRICKDHLVAQGADVHSFAVCAPKQNIVDSCIFNSLCFIFPWGLDV
jgi:hypoxanthine phosphoribosyltransferase